MLAAAALVAGCGDGSDSTGSSSEPAASQPAPPKSAFPSAEGKTLADIVNETDGHAELVVSPAALVFRKGENRYPVGVFHPDRSQVDDAQVALYVARVPSMAAEREAKLREAEENPSAAAPEAESGKGALAKARAEALEQPAIGPFPAAIESLATKPAYRAQTTTSDPDAATSVYTTDIDFTGNGEWRIAALIKQGDETTATLLPSATVGGFKSLPRVGEKAPVISTPTPEDTGGDLSEITTRVPPDTRNRVDYADVVGKEPVILLFATPQFCQSRVCGPVVDVAEQVKDQYGDEAEFIHMEIFKDNDPGKGVRPQVRAFHLPSEPWLFGIDRNGVIRAEVEGAFGVDRLTEVVKEVTAE